MADLFLLQIATPERLLVDEEVTEAELPGKAGYFGVLANHAPLLSALGAGVLTFSGGSSSNQVLAIDGGFVEVFENQVRVLADDAEYAREINAEAARRELEEANARLKEAATQGEAESQAALRAVARAQARIDAAERAR